MIPESVNVVLNEKTIHEQILLNKKKKAIPNKQKPMIFLSNLDSLLWSLRFCDVRSLESGLEEGT